MPEHHPTGPLTAPAPRSPAAPEPPGGPPRTDRQGAAILMICASALIFAAQDGVSRHLAAVYSPVFIVMLRYWFFAAFVVLLCARAPGGLGRAIRSGRPLTQIFRGVLLVAEVVLMIEAFVRMGLINTHAIFICYPLMISALSGPLLGEKVGWRRWAAVAVGFLGILIVLKPGSGVFSADAMLPLTGAAMFAVYGLLTRLVSREDSAVTSFFWTGIAGAGAVTLIGIWHWEPMASEDIPWLLVLCFSGVAGHFLLIKAYELAEASALQPFSYTQLVWVSIFGVTVFGETLAPNVAIGGLIVVGAGLFTWWRSYQRERAGRR
ncbi:DMT family transporter [Paracoccus sp. P2]|uniref:DMT family transporter n=1 Tax=Paracoccus pantotrophus TaxID=82367 RepID=A0A1I5JNN8_PARPN|nr:DMT family transporter [Paracoccus pantotrophus]MDF3853464.1 DMT family transporter [Paracoccus pantotrophus]QFG38018.1 DMT family transporter [Paracoccus pantotrophus]QLH15574.1 DMT family transporter [Paracoccus pantotrophus]RDD96833.1 DMT family transporter [Paracoccus pantotrophus]RKS51494.1 drug/metabolite transporter (DMT)-like permease [Paracoccus pantotrophus]